MIKFKNRTGNCYVMGRVLSVSAALDDGYSWLILEHGSLEVVGTPEMIMEVLAEAEDSWISVKDQLPEEGVKTFVRWGDGLISIAWLHRGNWYRNNNARIDTVTHWVPTPKKQP